MSSNQVVNFVPPGGAVGEALLPQSLLALNKSVSDGLGGGINRISIKGTRFRLLKSGQQVAKSADDFMDVVIAAGTGHTSRKYYKDTYTGESGVKPTCWSTNGVTPDAAVPAPDGKGDGKQHSNCAGCHQNTKGSKVDGDKQFRACSFSRRLVVVPPAQLMDGTATEDDLFALDVNATSAFGKGDPARGKYSLQSYIPFLSAPRPGFPKGIAMVQVVTRLEFDEESSTPRLFFSVAPNEENNASFLSSAALEKLVELSETAQFKRLIEVHAEDFVESEGATTETRAIAPPKSTKTEAAKKTTPAPAPAPAATKSKAVVPEKTWRDVAHENGIDEDDIQTIEDRGGPYSEKGRKFWDKVAPDGLEPPALETNEGPSWQEVAAEAGIEADDIQTIEDRGGPYSEKGRKFWDKVAPDGLEPPVQGGAAAEPPAPPAPPAPPKLRDWKVVAAEAGADEDDIETLESKGGPGTEAGLKYWNKVVKVSLDGVDVGGAAVGVSSPAPAPAAEKAKGAGGRPRKNTEAPLPPVTSKAGSSLADKLSGFDD